MVRIAHRKPKISVIVIVYNEERYIEGCIKSILNQSFKNFELIIVDDCSTDNTFNIVNRFKDIRIVKIRNKKNYNVAKARNIGLKAARGDLVFFTDADCVADRDWLKSGLEQFKNKAVIGVSGLTYYVTKNYKPAIRDIVRGEQKDDIYATCNMAYRRDTMQKLHGFNESRYDTAYEDGDLALRARKLGKIVCFKGMKVLHQKKEYSIGILFKRAKWVKYKVRIIKDNYFFPKWRTFDFTRKRKVVLPLRILSPTYMVYILFPPYFLFHACIFRRIVSVRDLAFLLGLYFFFIFHRLVIWKTAVQERVFVF